MVKIVEKSEIAPNIDFFVFQTRKEVQCLRS